MRWPFGRQCPPASAGQRQGHRDCQRNQCPFRDDRPVLDGGLLHRRGGPADHCRRGVQENSWRSWIIFAGVIRISPTGWGVWSVQPRPVVNLPSVTACRLSPAKTACIMNTPKREKSLAIPGTLLISAIGIMEDVNKAVTMDFKEAGNAIYVVGMTANEIGRFYLL